MARRPAFKKINRLFRRGGWQRLRRWAKQPRGLKKRAKHWGTLRQWAARKTNWYRKHKKWDRAKFTAKKQTIYAKEWKRARRRWQENQDENPRFELWMLNGHGANITDELKPIIAFLVVVRQQTITDTYNYGGHSPTSLHYPWNNADGKCHAVDSAGANMGSTMLLTLRRWAKSKFRELFGPLGWYIKNGQRLPGMFPGHGTHQHTGV